MKIRELYSDVLTEDVEFEFKAILNPDNPIKWAKTIVGFANGDGGIIFVGVSDDQEAFGLRLKEIDETKILVSKVNDRHIFPHVKISYIIRNVDEEAERFILALQVKPSESIVRFRDGDYSERVYIKGDGNTTPASPEEIIALSKRKTGVDNETSEIKYAEAEWMDYLHLCQEYRKDGSSPDLKELQSMEVVSGDGYAKSGLLMFKDDYDQDDSLICCRLWPGLKKAGEVIDSARYKGPLSKVFREAFSFIERNTKRGWRKTEKGGREEIRAYPREAVREALVNAIAHRDYSIAGTQIDVDIYADRIDIISPGSWLLPKPFAEYPLGAIPSIRRNAIVAACLDTANLMERSGTGFQMMFDSYWDAPAEKQPCVLIYPGILDLRLYDRLYKENTLSEMTEKERILSLLTESPRSMKELQEVTHYKTRTAFLKELINPMLEEGVIYRDGDAKSPATRIRLKDFLPVPNRP